MGNSEKSIGVWTSILYRYRRSFLLKKLENYGALGRAFLLVLIVHHNDGINQEKISDLLKTDKASIARAIKNLKKEGYVIRESDTVDKRAYKVYLTPKAEALVPEIQNAIDEWEHLVVTGVPKEAYQIIEQYMEQMAENACHIYSENIGPKEYD